MKNWNGNFELVDPNVLIVDHRYQRDDKPTIQNLVARNPVWEALAVIVCFKRTNGMLYVVDGQQRLRGLQAAVEPPKRVPVIWFPVQSLEEEARIFGVINEYRKSLQPLEKHTAKVVAKDPAALAVERSVEKVGYSLGQHNGGRSISAVATLNGIYNMIGEEGLVQTLSVIRDAWPDDLSGLSTHVLRGVADIIGEQNGNYSRAKLTTSIAKTSPSLVLRKAQELRFDFGGSMQANVRRAFKTLVKV